MNVAASKHIPVFLDEAMTALQVREGGRYLDCTLGRCGHAQAIVNQLGSGGKLVALDRDMDAIEEGREIFAGDERVVILHGDFARLEEVLAEANESEKFDGILLDFGVSSPQLDQAERGFSFMQDGNLDMRMDRTKGITAEDWLAKAKEEEIANVIFQFGEERLSRRIAKAIVVRREEQPITSTIELAKLIEAVVPARRVKGRKLKHPATRTFQAIRIYINDELGQITNVLPQTVRLLKQNGRLAVISFHSLEDRLVKRFTRDLSKGKQLPRNIPLPIDMMPEYKAPISIIGKAVKPSDAEIERNARARSAILRVVERTEAAYAKV